MVCFQYPPAISNGTFKQSCQSLQIQKTNELTLNSSTTAELPLHFNYYCIFDITTDNVAFVCTNTNGTFLVSFNFIICSRTCFTSSRLFLSFTANTRRNPLPSFKCWSLSALYSCYVRKVSKSHVMSVIEFRSTDQWNPEMRSGFPF